MMEDKPTTHGGPRPGAGRKPIELDDDAVLEMWYEGLSKREIARRLSISYDTILKHFRSNKEHYNVNRGLHQKHLSELRGGQTVTEEQGVDV